LLFSFRFLFHCGAWPDRSPARTWENQSSLSLSLSPSVRFGFRENFALSENESKGSLARETARERHSSASFRLVSMRICSQRMKAKEAWQERQREEDTVPLPFVLVSVRIRSLRE
jgi:hypothetical protein